MGDDDGKQGTREMGFLESKLIFRGLIVCAVVLLLLNAFMASVSYQEHRAIQLCQEVILGTKNLTLEQLKDAIPHRRVEPARREFPGWESDYPVVFFLLRAPLRVSMWIQYDSETGVVRHSKLFWTSDEVPLGEYDGSNYFREVARSFVLSLTLSVGAPLFLYLARKTSHRLTRTVLARMALVAAALMLVWGLALSGLTHVIVMSFF